MNNHNFISSKILKNKNNKKIIVSDKKNEISWSTLYDISRFNYDEITKSESKVIPILCDRSVKTFVSIVSLIMAGKAFCPISEKLPIFRIKKLIKRINSDLIINNSNIKISGVKNYKIKMKKRTNKIKNLSFSENLNDNNIAYVLFTSGSTGEPKGVKLSYENLLNTLTWSRKHLNWKNNDTIGIATNFSFDISMFDLLSCIYFEVKSYIFQNPENPITTYEEINLNKITSIFSVPAFFSNFIYYDLISKPLTSLRRIISGGDFFPSKNILTWKKHHKKIEIYNVWGPTETSIVNTMHKLNNKNLKELKKNKSLPVGKSDPLMEIKIHSKNKFTNKAFLKGEICMFGKCVSKGYLGNEKNETSYIYNNKKKGFLTGDIGYFDDQKNLHIIGRTDNTAKISGYRVDLKEIENVTLEIKDIIDCKSIIVEKGIYKILTLCVLSSKKINIEIIKNLLKKKLPIYAIPKFIFLFKKFPKNKNFKVDLKRLKSFSKKNVLKATL